MASSMNGQDKSNPAPARLGLPSVSRKKNFPESHIINPLLTSLFGQDGFILALFFFACLWTLTLSRSINTQKKKNLANIQSSRPYTWSITHTYCSGLGAFFSVV